MLSARPVVIDTNILFSALLSKKSGFVQTILGSGQTFYICESVIVELFKHKEKLVVLSRLSEEEVIRLFYTILRHVTISKEALIDRSFRQKAYELCANIDEADSPHVALTLKLDGLLWTGDKKLKTGLQNKGFTSFFTPVKSKK